MPRLYKVVDNYYSVHVVGITKYYRPVWSLYIFRRDEASFYAGQVASSQMECLYKFYFLYRRRMRRLKVYFSYIQKIFGL